MDVQEMEERARVLAHKLKIANEVLDYLEAAQKRFIALGLSDQSALTTAAQLIDLDLERAEFARENIPQRRAA